MNAKKSKCRSTHTQAHTPHYVHVYDWWKIDKENKIVKGATGKENTYLGRNKDKYIADFSTKIWDTKKQWNNVV